MNLRSLFFVGFAFLSCVERFECLDSPRQKSLIDTGKLGSWRHSGMARGIGGRGTRYSPPTEGLSKSDRLTLQRATANERTEVSTASPEDRKKLVENISKRIIKEQSNYLESIGIPQSRSVSYGYQFDSLPEITTTNLKRPRAGSGASTTSSVLPGAESLPPAPTGLGG